MKNQMTVDALDEGFVPADAINQFVEDGGHYSHTIPWLEQDQYGVNVVFVNDDTGHTLTLWAFNVKVTDDEPSNS